jgi:zinc transport system substrate-binding protein
VPPSRHITWVSSASPAPTARLLACAALLLGLWPGVLLAAPLSVGVSVAPLGYLAGQIGGPRLEVMTLIPPGTEPETYAPRPRQLEALAGLDLYLAVGHPALSVEARQIIPQLDPGTVLVQLAEPDGRSAREAGDPHLWLSPKRMRAFGTRVEAALISLDPEGAPLYRANAEAFRAAVDALIRDLETQLQLLPEPRRFVVEHPAWTWFAEDFDLVQTAIELDGKPVGPRGLIPLIEALRADGTTRLFVQPGTPHRSASLVAGEIGATLVVIDPLAEDWPQNLRSVAAQIAEGR